MTLPSTFKNFVGRSRYMRTALLRMNNIFSLAMLCLLFPLTVMAGKDQPAPRPGPMAERAALEMPVPYVDDFIITAAQVTMDLYGHDFIRTNGLTSLFIDLIDHERKHNKPQAITCSTLPRDPTIQSKKYLIELLSVCKNHDDGSAAIKYQVKALP